MSGGARLGTGKSETKPESQSAGEANGTAADRANCMAADEADCTAADEVIGMAADEAKRTPVSTNSTEEFRRTRHGLQEELVVRSVWHAV